MRKAAWALIAAVAIAGGLSCATAVKTDVGWNTKADFSQFKTWAWKDDGSIRDPTWNRRVQAVFEDELAKHGLTRSDKDASL